MVTDKIDDKLAVIQWGVIISASLIAAFCDLRTRKISNALTLPLLLAGFIWATLNSGLSGLVEAAAVCCILALPYIFLFLFAKGGAGDAKMMGAIGAWLGFRQGITVLFCVAAAGIVFAIIKSIIQKQTKVVLTSVFVTVYTFMLSLTGQKIQVTDNLTDNEKPGEMEMPYGVAIFTGVLVGGFISWLI